MINSVKRLTPILIFTALALAACGGTSPERSGLPEKFQSESVATPEIKTIADPKINILFVVDNSGSMLPYQEIMAKNIEKFANEFFENPRLNYRIGVVPVYDSKYLNDKTVYQPSGIRKMNPLGELVALKGLPTGSEAQLFITRDTPQPKEVLKQTVMIGVQWGPEAEESFSPVLAVVDPIRNANINQGFYEEDAYLAVFFLTDADDVTPGLSAESFYEKLVALKNGDSSKVLIAAALPNLDNESAKCKKDGHGPVQAFPSLLAVSGGIHADLCSDNFGETLAGFGKKIIQRVGKQKISIGFTPDINTLVVNYGVKGAAESELQLLQLGTDYQFNPEADEIVISPDLKVKRVSGGSILVDAKPINYSNHKNGRLKRLGK